jgi:hypothetical protein
MRYGLLQERSSPMSDLMSDTLAYPPVAIDAPPVVLPVEIGPQNPVLVVEIGAYGSLKGDPGPTGPAGPRGSRWFVGHGAPDVVVGSDIGDFYLDTDTGEYYLMTS